MKKSRNGNRPGLLSISEAAWILGVNDGRVCRAIRLGLLPVVRRRGRLLIPAHALAHLADDSVPCTGSDVRGGA
ncbi:MAG TPA: helix-turn-helix domain-containing protein [Pseudonocardiaceae bacterium]|nr:helix-turn-helix domain-containing protein [Pseudonocardiaceae bacterium]